MPDAPHLGGESQFSVISVYILSLRLFNELPHLGSLTILQDPRRNLYGPILVFLPFPFVTVNVTRFRFFRRILALVIKLFALADAELQLDILAGKIQ